MRYLYLLLYLFSSLIQAEMIWLDQDWNPVKSETEAKFYIKGPLIEQNGLWPVTAYYVGGETVRFKGTNNHPDVAQAKSVGDYQYFYENGQLEAIGKRNNSGELEGEMLVFYRTGELLGKYQHLAGQHHGKHETFFVDGKPKRVFHMVDDKLNGEDIYYYEEGGVYRSQEYVNGEKHGKERYYSKDGFLFYEYNYANGKQHGMAMEFFRAGHKAYEKNFHHGLKHGVERYWKENGHLSQETYYINGKEDGESRGYDDEGRLRYFNNYKQGKKVGIQLTYHYHSEVLSRKEEFDDKGRMTFQESFNKEGGKYYEQINNYQDGHVITDTKTFRDGLLIKREQQDKAKNWQLVTRFDKETGELIKRHETLNDQKNNLQVIRFRNGAIETSNYQHGKRHGEYSKESKDSTVVTKGQYANDKQVGQWYYNDKDLKQTYYYNQAGKLEGEFRQVTADSSDLIKLAHYRNGELHGSYEHYFPNSKLTEEKGEFINGKRHGAWQKLVKSFPYELWIGEYQDGKPVGDWRTVSDFGYTLSRGQYDSQGRKQGTFYYFAENGLLEKVERYLDDHQQF